MSGKLETIIKHLDYATEEDAEQARAYLHDLEADCRLFAELVVESWKAGQCMMDADEYQRATAWLAANPGKED